MAGLHFAINVVSHCNLKCNFCNHHASFTPKMEMQPEDYIQHFEQFSKKCGNIGGIRLSGGEPFLHSNLAHFVKSIRPHTPRLIITSNMTWLKSEADLESRADIFNNVDEFFASIYQHDDKIPLAQQISKFGVQVVIRRIKNFVRSEFLNQNEEVTRRCSQRDMTNLLINGKLARCPVVAYANYNPQVTQGFLSAREDDFFDLYGDADFETWKREWPFRTCHYCTLWRNKKAPWSIRKAKIYG